jgi:hypothetical protein
LSAKNCSKLNKITVSYKVDVILTCPDEKGHCEAWNKGGRRQYRGGMTSESAGEGGGGRVEEGIGNEIVIEGVMCA